VIPPGERRHQPRMTAEHVVALVPLVHGHIRLLAWKVLPSHDAAAGQPHHRPVGQAVVGVPADGHRFAARRRAGQDRPEGILGRLNELD
jgi:hypothetical protein